MLTKEEIVNGIRDLFIELRDDDPETLQEKIDAAVSFNAAYQLAKSGRYEVFTGPFDAMEAHFASIISNVRIAEEFYLLETLGTHVYGFFGDMLHIWVNNGAAYFTLGGAVIDNAWKIRRRKRRLNVVLTDFALEPLPNQTRAD